MRGQLFLLRQMEPRAVIDARDHKGRRPLEVAEENRQGAVENYLKSAMYLPQVRVGGTITFCSAQHEQCTDCLW